MTTPAHPQLREPVFAFDQKNDLGDNIFVDVSSTSRKLLEHVLDLERITTDQPTRIDEFHFFDTAGRRLEANGDSDLVVVTGDQKNYRKKIRKHVRKTLRKIASEFDDDPEFDELMKSTDSSVAFQTFARDLAEAFAEPSEEPVAQPRKRPRGNIAPGAPRHSRPAKVWKAVGFQKKKKN